MHTYLCGHAYGRPEEYVQKAKHEGIRLITFTCHVPIQGNGFLQDGIRMRQADLPRYKDMVEKARVLGEALGVEVLYGIEAEVFPEEEKLGSMKKMLSEEPFDFILGSLHHQLPVYQRWLHEHGRRTDNQKIESYFQHLAQGASSGLYHSMSHPDLIRIYGTVDNFEPKEHESVIKAFLQQLVSHNVCLEVNTSGLIKGVYKLHPDPMILAWANALGVRLTMGSDSHRPEQVGQFFPETRLLLKEIGFKSISYFRKGRRIDVSLNRFETP